MLESVRIQKRQSEIRQALAELSGQEKLTEDETRQIDTLDGEYRQNESRFRAALIAEDEERREAGAELETREGRERGFDRRERNDLRRGRIFPRLMSGFEACRKTLLGHVFKAGTVEDADLTAADF